MAAISTATAAVIEESERELSLCETVLSDKSIFRLRREADRGVVALGKTLAEKAVGLERLRQRFAPYSPQVKTAEDFWALLLESLEINVAVQGSLEQIPGPGKPVVIAANHPYGFLDGVSLPHVIAKRRDDYMILGNATLSEIPEIRERIIPLKIVAKDRKEQIQNAKFNLRGIEKAKQHLLSGGALIIFPSGVVGTAERIFGENNPALEGAWQPTAAKLIMETGSSFLPVYFDGKNSALFHLVSRLPEKLSGPLRLALIPSELLKKSGQTVNLTLGKEIKAIELDLKSQGSELPRDRAILEQMRNETLKLSGDPKLFSELKNTGLQKNLQKRSMKEIDPRVPLQLREQLVNEAIASGKMEVYREAKSKLNGDPLTVLKISGKNFPPQLLHQLGVLREETFRKVGEGSGMGLDLDSFDEGYDHLLVWNGRTKDIVGAYRLGSYEEARATGNYSLMYSDQVFNYSPEFFQAFQGEMVEMGRSFVVFEHQNDPDILKLLWGGIAEYLYRHEGLRYLCGPVSLSGDYSDFSKTIIKAYYMRFHGDQTGLGRFVTPSQAFTGEVKLSPKILEHYLQSLSRVSDLDSYIESLEGEGRGIPPLMKHYPGLMGAKFISASEDPLFNTLDFLICVDIKELNERKAEMFVGDKAKAKALAERFR